MQNFHIDICIKCFEDDASSYLGVHLVILSEKLPNYSLLLSIYIYLFKLIFIYEFFRMSV